jgi:hypothetical protein
MCTVLPSHHPIFIFGRVLSRKNFLEKKNLAGTLVEDPLVAVELVQVVADA